MVKFFDGNYLMVQGLLKDCCATTEELYKTVQQKLREALTVTTFLDGIRIAERLLFDS